MSLCVSYAQGALAGFIAKQTMTAAVDDAVERRLLAMGDDPTAEQMERIRSPLARARDEPLLFVGDDFAQMDIAAAR